MDIEMETEEEFVAVEPIWVRDVDGDGDDFDIDYEFDASKCYDFSRQETELEAQESEFWFEIAPSYPPSPFAIKAKRRSSFASLEPAEISTDHNNYIGLESDNQIVQDIAKAEAKSPVKSPRSKNSFMNPTASQLAKKNCWPENHCVRLIRRFTKFSVENEEKNSKGSSVIGNQATKRQKLEAGYLRKVACLKHQALFQHKEPKKVDDSPTFGRTKATIPREPILRTSYRAERHRSKLNLESDENAKPNPSCAFKARPLNRKILRAPSFPLPRKSTPQRPDFQVFHLRTMERARTSERAATHRSSINNAANVSNSNPISQNGTTDPRSMILVKKLHHFHGEKSNSTLKEKPEALDKFKPRCLNRKEPNSPTKRFRMNLTIESFSKLSLASEVHSNANAQTKLPLQYRGSKENAPGCLNL
ncbi:PREDICTED: protein TPX2-like isoform X1 [Populus euphratica]|uniref:Protein TPX2-like isoform X1 n=1 Tax=Populus euphratica TaxID=75702 RepID=A0AAJ6UHC0_POPEU|nr:PREDICTED: protein TPX2-like isoform X1 [Populus euphratica]